MLILAACATDKSADLVIIGKIYTVNSTNDVAQAVAVTGGKISFVGSAADVEKYIGEKTQVIRLQNQVVTPGFIEGHGHLMGVGYNEMELDLSTIKSYDEMVEKVREAVSKSSPGEWILGRGWHQDKWDSTPKVMVNGFPVHNSLSAVSPDNPVFLRHASGHAGFANANAMRIAGVPQLTIEKKRNGEGDGGEVVRDELGNATGLFNERAMTMIEQFIPPKTVESDRKALDLAIQVCQRNGITSFHDAGATRENLALFQEQKRRGALGVRIYAMITGWDRDLVYEWLKKGPEIDSTGLLTIRSIKLNACSASPSL
jgi:predicted amidohydrolase YtcJ